MRGELIAVGVLLAVVGIGAGGMMLVKSRTAAENEAAATVLAQEAAEKARKRMEAREVLLPHGLVEVGDMVQLKEGEDAAEGAKVVVWKTADGARTGQGDQAGSFDAGISAEVLEGKAPAGSQGRVECEVVRVRIDETEGWVPAGIVHP